MLRDAVDLIEIRAADLHIDGAGAPEFKMASTIEPMEKNVEHRGTGWPLPSVYPIHIFEAAEPVRLVQGYLDGCSIGARVGGIERGKIRDSPNVGNNVV